jgi:hypothetical protein
LAFAGDELGGVERKAIGLGGLIEKINWTFCRGLAK